MLHEKVKAVNLWFFCETFHDKISSVGKTSKEPNMNERDKKKSVIMYWLLVTIMGLHVCDGYSRNTIKDYNNKEYLVASTNVVNNKFEDNEIRGESEFSPI